MSDKVSLSLVRMKRQYRFAPVGECVYCRAEPGSVEHIIPRNLGGMLFLPDACCPKCRDITGAFEGRAADTFYKPIRRQLGFPRRHKNQPRPPMVAEVDGAHTILEDDDFPGILVALNLPPPSVLKLGPPATEFVETGVDVYTLPEFEPRISRLRIREQMKVRGQPLDTVLFCRLLAKIGHCYAAAELGIDGFKPNLLDVIKDPDAKYVGEFIGSAMMKDDPGDDLHEVYLDDFFDRSQHVVVCVRLFANYGLPTYWVVAGERLH